jgi:hypothetical protein
MVYPLMVPGLGRLNETAGTRHVSIMPLSYLTQTKKYILILKV